MKNQSLASRRGSDHSAERRCCRWMASNPAFACRKARDSFIVNTGASATPEFILYKVKSAKDKREVAIMSVSSFGGMKTGEDVVSLNVTKMKDGVYQLTPAKKLAKREYFIPAKPASHASSM